MPLQVHGIEYENEARSVGWLRAGVLRICLWSIDSSAEGIWDDEATRYGITQFRAGWTKFDRAAEHIGRNVEIIRRRALDPDPPRRGPENDLYWSAVRDIPLYIDLLGLYLRIQADALAVMLPSFYGRKGTVPRTDFRSHLHWFTRKRAKFDAPYSEILRSHSDWFYALSGEESRSGKGLRNVFAHALANAQLHWSTPGGVGLRFSVPAWRGFEQVYPDVLEAVRDIVRLYFRYLDAVYEHFVPQLSGRYGAETVTRGLARRETSEHFSVGPYYSHWPYPVIEQT